MSTNINESFEYQAEQAKHDFQNNLAALLEAHADFLHKISHAKSANKTGVWIELSEAEIISGHILECVTNLSGDYKIIHNTNKLLNTNYQAVLSIAKKDLRNSIEDFKGDKITREQFSQRVDDFIGIRKPLMKAI